MEKEEKLELAKEILRVAAMTTLVVGAVIAPPAAGAVAKLYLEYKRYNRSQKWQYRSRVRRTIKRLKNKGYVVTESKGEEFIVKLTQAGRRFMHRDQIDHLTIKKPKQWDKSWRVAIFDIPEDKREVRNIVRSWLKRNGFKELQQSAWIMPWPCEKEIELLKAEYKLGNQLILLETKAIAKEKSLRRNFGI